MVFVALGVSLVAALLLYLSAANQQWLARGLSGPWRRVAWGLLAGSLALWMQVLDAKAGVFAGLVSLMLFLGVLPLLSLLKPGEGARGKTRD